ncbi:MAG: LamG-like jellyroll fold domain-containing protein, partial [Flavobacteriaceae bacterium]|nr:LamG-like jellyroll fold domain-containing protein [Flavobacteriaceae bacterium]
GVISLTNSANINQFNQDLDYLVWGSNNGTFTADGSNTMPIKSDVTTAVTRINRKWKIVESGTDVGDVIVSIPQNALTTSFSKLATEEYTLIVADDSGFGNASIIDVVPLKSDGNGNLTTWYDFDGTKYFTFGKAPKLEEKNHINIAAGDYLIGEYGLNLNSGSFSVACWIKNDGSSATNRTIIAKGPDLVLRLNSNHKIEALWDGVSHFISNTSINDGKWHHITAVYTGGSAFLYIDGILDKAVYSIPNPNPNYYRFSVGATYLSKSNIINPFRGEIDELHIWDQILLPNQINYLMNQEIVKHSDATTNGKIIPQTIAKNEIKTIPWSTIKAYYDFNSFYGTTVEGLTNDRNFLRIRYLSKTKTIVNTQTAPLPYETIADGAWSNAAVWKNGSIQRIPNDNSIIVGSPQQVINGNIVKINHNITSAGNKTVLGLFVDGVNTSNYKTLSAQNDTKVEVSHYLKLDGLIDLQGKSQLIQTTNSELDASSKGFIKRSQQGTGNKFNYNYWSSPVGPINAATNNNNYTLSGVFKDGTNASNPQNITWIGGLNGTLGTPISLARYWLYKFENGSQYADWVQINENGALRPSQGFTLKGAGAIGSTQNYTFVGKPFNGTISGNSVLANDLFLVGNPYPSAIDAYQFITDNINTIEGTIYIWEHSPSNDTHYLSEYTGGYATITLTGSTAPVVPALIKGLGTSTKIPKQYIPIGQAFLVYGKPDIGSAQPVIFNNGQRFFVKEDAVDDTGAAISNALIRNTGKTSKTTELNRFDDNSNYPIYNDYYTKIRLGIIMPNTNYRELLIGFLNYEATDNVDKGYDGTQIDTQANDAYFLIENNPYNIQGVGYFDTSKSYPIGIKTAVIGTTRIKIDAAEFLNTTQKVYIHDKATNIYHDITTQPLDLNLPIGVYDNRFALSFGDKLSQTLSEEEEILPENLLNIYLNNAVNKLNIQKTASIEIKKIELYNMLGQLIFSLNNFNTTNIISVDFPTNTSTGVYLVKVTTNVGLHSKKVIKN